MSTEDKIGTVFNSLKVIGLRYRRVDIFVFLVFTTCVLYMVIQGSWLDASTTTIKKTTNKDVPNGEDDNVDTDDRGSDGVDNLTGIDHYVIDSSKDKTSDFISAIDVQPDLTQRAIRKLAALGRTDFFKSNRECHKRLPDCIIIGVMKAGTEAFSTFLGIHPQVAMQFNVRATCYFTSNYKKGIEWYKDQMMCASDDQVTVEKSPQYWSPPNVPERIHKMKPNIKLILMVRNPIDRAVSHFLQVKSAHPDQIGKRTFEQMVLTGSGKVAFYSQFIKLSTYSTVYKQWLRYFSKNQILIIDGDDFKENQIQSLSKTEDFLGIKRFITRDKFVFNEEKGFYCLKTGDDAACLGEGKGRAHPEVGHKLEVKLKAFFKPYNEEFYKLSGTQFKW